jgi:hypothetical protein
MRSRLSILSFLTVSGFVREPLPEQPFPLPAAHRPSVEEMIVQESLAAEMPPDLALDLAWEESRFDPFALRHEGNGSWSSGIFQINGPRPVFGIDQRAQIRSGVAIAAHWWMLTHDRALAKRAFRRGHL